MALSPFHTFVISVGVLSLLLYRCNIDMEEAVGSLVSPTSFAQRQNNFDRRSCLKGAFKDILLLIVYNYPYYDSIPMFLRLYRPAFHRVVFCGPPGNTSYDVITLDIARGILGYQCLARAVERHPRYSGYLFMSDDMILNFWNFHDFDRTRIWQSSSSFSRNALYVSPTEDWYWWASQYGLKNCEKSFEDVVRLLYSNSAKEKAEKWIERFVRNGGGKLHCYTGRSDILYIPRKFAQDFTSLSNIFYDRKVFLEIAIPTILRFLEDEVHIDKMDGYYIPGDVRQKDPRVTDSRYFWMIYMWKRKAWFIHPFKLKHKSIDNKFNLAMFNHILMEKSRQYTKCSKEIIK